MVDAVIAEISSAIHVRHIQTAIEDARRIVRQDSGAEIFDFLTEHQFDAAPVFDGQIIGLIRAEDLNPADGLPVENSMQGLSDRVMIEGSAPISRLLDRFEAGHRFMFVVGAVGITGMVTPSDLNKQAGRTHLYMELCALELALVQSLSEPGLADGRWLAHLPGEHARAIEKSHAKRRAQDESAGLLAELNLRDLLAIHREMHLEGDAWDRVRGPEGDLEVKAIAKFRNAVMHSVLDVTTDEQPRTEELIEVTRLVSGLLDPLITGRRSE